MSDHSVTALFDPNAKPVAPEILERLHEFAQRWKAITGNEQQLAQGFLEQLCEALGTAKPYDGTLPAEDYCFEKKVVVPGTGEHGRIDLYKKGHFVLEAKCGRSSNKDPGSAPVRGTPAYASYIQGAYEGQARFYAGLLSEGRPPLLIVADVGHALWIWPKKGEWYGEFFSPLRIVIPLDRIADEDNARVLLACFEAPHTLDRTHVQEAVTFEAAERLAELAARLGRRHDPHEVARFLMRCIFCMFAEDVELLPPGAFSRLLAKGLQRSDLLAPMLSALFQAMDRGQPFDFELIRRFNGALFKDATALPLQADEVHDLAGVAALDWSFVEPSIFGTLLERALDPRERHRLGAHYTPRAYVERLVRATIDEPLRAEWDAVQARVDELLAADDDSAAAPTPQRLGEARKLLGTFRERVARVRVLDPACGTGNFLVVAYAMVKALEHEVLEALRTLGGGQQGLAIEGESVVPSHFLGLEINEWAAEIAQLVLWMGHLQWEIRHRGRAAVPDPVLSEERSIQHRDALIDYQAKVPRVGPDGQPLTRWDGRTNKVHHVTGKEVPDTSAQVPVFDYQGVTRAAWPEAEFIVGNPPFIGNKVMREALGDPYVEAVRAAYPDVPNVIDFVVYWWHRAAQAVREGRARRFGLITTNSLGQTFNRQVIAQHLDADPRLDLLMAIADHPWVDEGAAVRISMTVAERAAEGVRRLARLGRVTDEADPKAVAVAYRPVTRIHADLTAGADVASAVPLKANANLSFQGMNLVGKGFRLTPAQVTALGYDLNDLPPIIRPHLNARELMQGRLENYVIDAFGLTAEQLRDRYPPAYQWLYDHVKPERDQNRDAQRKRDWWLFGRSNSKLRAALQGRSRFIATARTAKHRVFVFLDIAICPDCKLVAVTLSDSFALGVLSSHPHVVWSLATGGTLEDRPTYDNTRCFDTYPFPDPTPEQRARIAELGEALDGYRKRVLEQHPDVHLTKMYNLLAKHRAQQPFSKAEQALHLKVGTDELARLHDALDAAVLDAYGWPADLSDDDLLERLVALNRERAAEEAAGLIRSLKDAAAAPVQAQATAASKPTAETAAARLPWPKDPLDQLGSVLQVLQASPVPLDLEGVASAFHFGQRKRIQAILDRLAERRLLLTDPQGRYRTTAAA